MNGQEVAEALRRAEQAHITLLEPEQFPVVAPGYSPFALDVDTHIAAFGTILRKGSYLRADSDILYELTPDLGSLLESIKEADKTPIENGFSIKAEDVRFKLSLHPVTLNAEPHIVLAYKALVAWLAISDAETEDAGREILHACFTPADLQSAQKPAQIIEKAPVDKLDWTLDKFNDNIWDLMQRAESGQFGFTFDDIEEAADRLETKFNLAKHGSDKPIMAICCIDFSDLEDSITKQLEPYDKRVCLAIGAVYNAGHEVMTLQMIYEAMGYSGKLGKADKKKLNNSITKLSGARLILDNREEADIYKRDYFTYDGAIVLMERVQAFSGGQLTNAAIRVFREPAPISFAKERKQFTTIPVAVLNSPLSKTSSNLRLEDYLIDRISHIRHEGERANNKILFETIYKHAGVKTRKQRERAPEKIEKLLRHYKAVEHIRDYKLERDGVRIVL